MKINSLRTGGPVFHRAAHRVASTSTHVARSDSGPSPESEPSAKKPALAPQAYIDYVKSAAGGLSGSLVLPDHCRELIEAALEPIGFRHEPATLGPLTVDGVPIPLQFSRILNGDVRSVIFLGGDQFADTTERNKAFVEGVRDTLWRNSGGYCVVYTPAVHPAYRTIMGQRGKLVAESTIRELEQKSIAERQAYLKRELPLGGAAPTQRMLLAEDIARLWGIINDLDAWTDGGELGRKNLVKSVNIQLHYSFSFGGNNPGAVAQRLVMEVFQSQLTNLVQMILQQPDISDADRLFIEEIQAI